MRRFCRTSSDCGFSPNERDKSDTHNQHARLTELPETDVCQPTPVVCLIRSAAGVLELFRFLRLLQNRFSVVLHFQVSFIAHGHYIAVAAF